MSEEGRQLPKTIKTERLTLRPFELGDMDDVLAYAQDPEFSRYVPVPHPYSRRDAEQYLARELTREWVSEPGWAIEFDGNVVGGLSLGIDFDNRRATMGYGIASRHRGKGLVPEAAGAVIDAAFATLPDLNRVWAFADARNVASTRVMQKLGMRSEGMLRAHDVRDGELLDRAVYGLLRAEWEAAR